MQTEICNEVFSTLQGFGDLENPAVSTEGARDTSPSLSQNLSEDYLQARAVLSSFMSRTGSLDDLNQMCIRDSRFRIVIPSGLLSPCGGETRDSACRFNIPSALTLR